MPRSRGSLLASGQPSAKSRGDLTARQEVASQLATVATVATEVPVPATEREAVEQAAATIVQVVRE